MRPHLVTTSREHTTYTLHPTAWTSHPTPWTLHPAPYTLHPMPRHGYRAGRTFSHLIHVITRGRWSSESTSSCWTGTRRRFPCSARLRRPSSRARFESPNLHIHIFIYIYIYKKKYIERAGNQYVQGWELTSLVHELFQQERELSRESVQLNSGSRAQDRFNKVELNKDLVIREPDWTTNEPTQNQANSGKLLYIFSKYQPFQIKKQVLRSLIARLVKRCTIQVRCSCGPIAHPFFLLSSCLHPLLRILNKSLLNNYWTLLNQVFNSTQQVAMISWFVDLAQLISWLLSSQP